MQLGYFTMPLHPMGSMQHETMIEDLEQIKYLYEFVGGFGVLLVMGHEWKPLNNWQNSMKLLVNEVIPKLTD